MISILKCERCIYHLETLYTVQLIWMSEKMAIQILLPVDVGNTLPLGAPLLFYFLNFDFPFFISELICFVVYFLEILKIKKKKK